MTDHGWREDVLGAPFEQLELPLGEDSEGPVVATLVRRRRSPADLLLHAHGPLRGVDVLYVHGWSDYFFQVELAERLERLGARFHALDLRKYGRSLRPRQTPGFVDDLTTYDEDIAVALDVIAAEHGRGDTGRRLVPMGHSTGGLTLSLWAARHPEHVAGVVLNSPWLEFQASAVGRALVAPVIKLGARRNPLAPLPAVDPGFYTRTVSAAGEGSWTYDQQWRPDRGFPLHPGWLAAVFDGQATVEAGLGIEVPVLVMLSDKSMLQPRWDDGMARADVALNVDVVAHRALSLGSEVTVRRLHGALHDVVLSVPEVREHAYDVIARWATTLRH